MNFLNKIFSPISLLISILFLVYTIYKSELHYGGFERDYYLIYYIISFTLVIFSIFTFYINQIFKEYLIIVLLSVIVSLYLFEGYLTFMEKSNKIYFKETGNKYDTRTKLEVYEDLKKLNQNITLRVKPSYYSNNSHNFYSLSGISNSETIGCNENGYFKIYKSDRYGFNNPDKEWDSENIEYLLVGDSFTHGSCVNRPNDIASVLRNLSNKSVLNLGSIGNGPLLEYATLREYIKPNVKKFLWVYYEGNDLRDLNNRLNHNILKKYLSDLNFSQNLIFKQNLINKLAREKIITERESEKKRELRESSFKYKFTKFIKIYNLRFSILPGSIPHQAPPIEFKQILKLTKNLVKNNNGELYFIYLPEYHRYKTSYDNSSFELVKSIVNELEIPFIDIHSRVFKNEKYPLKLFPFELYGHYNVDGYKKIAQVIYEDTKD